MVPCPSWRRAAALALALLVLSAWPASAHPFVRGGPLPVDSLATLTLVMGHGCGTEDAGAGAPTTEVALEVPDWLRVVEVPLRAGWIVDVERADDGRVEVVSWFAEEPSEPAPEVELSVVASGAPGQVRYLRVLQACEGSTYRWIGTPDDPAEDPAVRVELTEPDPDAPAPPEPEPAELEPAPDAPDAGPLPGASPDAGTATEDDPVTDDPAQAGDVADDVTGQDDQAGSDAAAARNGAPGGLGRWWLLGGIVAVSALIVAVRRRVAGRPR